MILIYKRLSISKSPDLYKLLPFDKELKNDWVIVTSHQINGAMNEAC